MYIFFLPCRPREKHYNWNHSHKRRTNPISFNLIPQILLYPEEGWARSAVTSHWIITPCKWQPNRYKIEEFIASQRHKTKAKMVRIDKSSFLIVGTFKEKKYDADFKLYLSSNISVEDYNMGYCLTGFVERLCPQTKTFQMTHFAVIKRQWPSTSSYVT